MRQNEQQIGSEKQNYEAPTIESLGSVQDLTQDFTQGSGGPVIITIT